MIQDPVVKYVINSSGCLDSVQNVLYQRVTLKEVFEGKIPEDVPRSFLPVLFRNGPIPPPPRVTKDLDRPNFMELRGELHVPNTGHIFRVLETTPAPATYPPTESSFSGPEPSLETTPFWNKREFVLVICLGNIPSAVQERFDKRVFLDMAMSGNASPISTPDRIHLRIIETYNRIRDKEGMDVGMTFHPMVTKTWDVDEIFRQLFRISIRTLCGPTEIRILMGQDTWGVRALRDAILGYNFSYRMGHTHRPDVRVIDYSKEPVRGPGAWTWLGGFSNFIRT